MQNIFIDTNQQLEVMHTTLFELGHERNQMAKRSSSLFSFIRDLMLYSRYLFYEYVFKLKLIACNAIGSCLICKENFIVDFFTL